MVITRIENGSPDMILTAFEGKFHDKKMGYLPGSIDSIYFNFFNNGNWRLDINPKMIINQVPGGPPWPDFGMHLPTILSKAFLHPKDPNFN